MLCHERGAAEEDAQPLAASEWRWRVLANGSRPEANRLLRLLLRRFDLGNVFGCVFLEVLQAGLAAKFYLPAFVCEDMGLHARIRAKFFVGDNAGIHRVGLDLLVGGLADESNAGEPENENHGC